MVSLMRKISKYERDGMIVGKHIVVDLIKKHGIKEVQIDFEQSSAYALIYANRCDMIFTACDAGLKIDKADGILGKSSEYHSSQVFEKLITYGARIHEYDAQAFTENLTYTKDKYNEAEYLRRVIYAFKNTLPCDEDISVKLSKLYELLITKVSVNKEVLDIVPREYHILVF